MRVMPARVLRRAAAVAVAALLLLTGRPSQAAVQLPQAHAFYYLWYGSEAHDGQFIHWNHRTLPHWEEHVRRRYPDVQYQPPELIHSPYYPLRGCFSSKNTSLLEEHFRDMKAHRITAAVVSWWGRPNVPGTHDSQGIGTDALLPLVFDAADAVGFHIAFHLEPYQGRSAESVAEDIQYLVHHYGHRPSLLRLARNEGGPALPVMYVYDSYHIQPVHWKQVLKHGGGLSIRGAAHDSFVIGLWLHSQHGHDLVTSGFDGLYTYFSSDGFSYGSTTHHWKLMAAFAHEHSKLFIPCIGPGYDDTRIRPWNKANRKPRNQGRYYDTMFEAAAAARPSIIAITSYNEWGEGTQIEAAVPHKADPAQLTLDLQAFRNMGGSLKSEDYSPHQPDYYMKRTAYWIDRLVIERKQDDPEQYPEL